MSMGVFMLADAMAASDAMRAFVLPAVATLVVLAISACAFFIVMGGMRYMASSGDPEKLAAAKQIIKNAVIGLVLVIAAAALTAILSHSYSASHQAMTDKLPQLKPIQPSTNNFSDAIIKGIVGVFRSLIDSIGEPFIGALGYFINGTPLMGNNSSVFNLWLAVVSIADVMFILVVSLLGFHIMSFATFGFDEVDVKQLMPQLVLIFLLMNTSIFIIDGVISLSNAMIYALQSGFQSTDIWMLLGNITKQSADIGFAGLLVMMAFLVLTVLLLIYYIGRLITLYLGAILSPLILLIWLIPAFKDFAITAFKTYLVMIFVLFVHVVIILLASSIFVGMLNGDSGTQPNAIMALLVGLATVLALLKTQGVMREFSYAASVPRAAREMSGQFLRGVNSMYRGTRAATGAPSKVSRFMSSKFGSPAGAGGSEPGTGSKAAAPSSPLRTGETRKAPKGGK
jgi:hypothetical protein